MNAKQTSGAPGTQDSAAQASLDWILNHSRRGFYALIASPEVQAAAIAPYADRAAVLDWTGKAFDLREIDALLKREPDRSTCLFLNFHLALMDQRGKWNPEAARKLNYIRETLQGKQRNFVFCLTKDADNFLNRNAFDFYSHLRLFLRFEDEAAETPRLTLPTEAARPMDRSKGVDIKVDFRLPEEELLTLAVSLGDQAAKLHGEARYADALHLLEKEREIREQILGREDADTASAYYAIGNLYDAMGEYTRALDWLQKAREIREKALGPNHPDTAWTYRSLGIVYDHLGNYAQALEWYQKAWAVLKKSLGKPDIAHLYEGLGNVYYHMGQYDQALVWHQQALEIQERELGPDHPDTANTYHNLGGVYRDMDEHAKALKWYQKALAVKEKVLGPDHPNTAETYGNLGSTYQVMGNFPQALEWHQKALAVKEKALGPNHPDTAATYASLGSVYQAMGSDVQALEWYQKALAVFEKALGPNHPDMATTYNGLGGVYYHMGDYGRALEWYQKALAVFESTLGEKHPFTAMTRRNLSTIRTRMEQQRAEESFREAASVRYVGPSAPAADAAKPTPQVPAPPPKADQYRQQAAAEETHRHHIKDWFQRRRGKRPKDRDDT